jgi:hypothetical protein
VVDPAQQGPFHLLLTMFVCLPNGHLPRCTLDRSIRQSQECC